MIIESAAGQVTGVRGDPDHPANFGRLCSKGSTLHLTATDAVRRHDRLLQPQWRADRASAPQPLPWDATLDRLADRYAAVIGEHGPDAVAFYVSGQLLTEEYYVFNKLAKGLIGTNNIDTNSRLCMSSAVAGYKQSLGADAPPACYDDIDAAECLFIAGSNTAWAHPILFRRIEDAKAARPGMKIVVVDPRRTATAEFADLHLQIQPGTDVALFNGMLHAMIWDDRIDRRYIADHTNGFDALKTLVRDTPPREAARICGVPVEAILQAADWFAASPATLSLWCQGLNQSSSGTAKNTALINLHLATGQIGRPGAGPLSLTGQPNAMGGREVGGLANLLSAHRDLANPAHRAEVARLWGVESVPERPGKAAVQLFEAAARGEIKALWIACTNPAQSMPDQALVRAALERCELVVLQEAFAHTATARYADVLLPASTWAEKDGTVTNSERRISRVRAAIAPPGEARDDWRIVADFARRLQARLKPDLHDLFPYESSEAVWNEHRESTRGRDLDITGLSYALLETAGPQQWPAPALAADDTDAGHPNASPESVAIGRPEAAAPRTAGTGIRTATEPAALGRARLYTDGRFATPDGRARFIATAHRAPAEPTDPRHPFALNTGRLRDQWHGMSRSGTVARLFGHEGSPAVRVHPDDLARRDLKAGDLVEVRSRRGAIVLPLVGDDRIGRAQAYVAMHWGDEFVSGRTADGVRRAGINALTTKAHCPDSLQPELKHAAVSIKTAALPWRLTAAAWLPADQVVAVRERMRAAMASFAYAACVPVGGRDGRTGIWLQAASAPPIEAAWVDTIAGWLGLHDASHAALRRPGARHPPPARARRRRRDRAARRAAAWSARHRPPTGCAASGRTSSRSRRSAASCSRRRPRRRKGWRRAARRSATASTSPSSASATCLAELGGEPTTRTRCVAGAPEMRHPMRLLPARPAPPRARGRGAGRGGAGMTTERLEASRARAPQASPRGREAACADAVERPTVWLVGAGPATRTCSRCGPRA